MKFRINRKRIELIRKYPHLIGHLIGKDDLKLLHSEWILYIWDTVKSHSALQAHRGSYKTTAVTIVGCIWWLLFHPSDRIAIIRKSFTDAADCLKAIREIFNLEVIEILFQQVHGIPPKATTKRDHKLIFNFKRTVTPEGSIDCYGLDTGITGKHYDKIICDDFITLRDRISKAEREKTKYIIREIVTNIIDPGKTVGFIGTPWHKDDAWEISAVPKPRKYTISDCGLLTPEEIKLKKELTTPSLYAANYELKHLASEDALFDYPEYEKWNYRLKNGVGHIDAGYEGDCYTALTFLQKKSDGDLQGIGWVFSDHIEDKYDFIMDKYKKYHIGSVYMEKNADKGFLGKELKRLGMRVADPYHESMNKTVKITTYLKKWWKRIKWDNETDDLFLEMVIDYREGQKPDDPPDSISSLIREHFEKSYNAILYEK